MEHPNIIREIDALIDSYNWENFNFRLGGKPSQIREVLFKKPDHDNEDYGRIWLLSDTREATPLIASLLFHVLDHPEWNKEGIVLKQFSKLPNFLQKYRQRLRLKQGLMYCLLYSSLPRFKRYLTHRNARYRAYAALSLSVFVYDPSEVIGFLLAHLQHERSPRVIYHLLYAILKLFSFRQGVLISLETQQEVLLRANLLLHAKHPLIQHISALLIMKILKHKTPEPVLDIMVKAWTKIISNDWPVYEVVGDPLKKHLLSMGQERGFDVFAQLISASVTHSSIAFIWEMLVDYDLNWRKLKGTRIAFTAKQKVTLEAFAASHVFWKWKQTTHFHKRYQLKYLGFEETRSLLRIQLQHAHIVDSIKPPPIPKRFPLRLNREILNEIYE